MALAVHNVLSTCCQRKTHLALPSFDEMKPKVVQSLEKPLTNRSKQIPKQTRPTPGASSGQAPIAGATTGGTDRYQKLGEHWELETTKCQLLRVGSDMVDATQEVPKHEARTGKNSSTSGILRILPPGSSIGSTDEPKLPPCLVWRRIKQSEGERSE